MKILSILIYTEPQSGTVAWGFDTLSPGTVATAIIFVSVHLDQYHRLLNILHVAALRDLGHASETIHLQRLGTTL